MVRKQRLPSPIVRHLNQALALLRPLIQYPVTPCWDSFLLGCVIYSRMRVVLVSRVEVELTLAESAENGIAHFDREQLILRPEIAVVAFLHFLLHLLLRECYPEV